MIDDTATAATGSLKIKLVDFGVSARCKRGQFLSDFCGSLHYMAPEVFLKQYTHASQIWSVGVVIFALLTLRFPFDGIDKLLLRDQVESHFPIFYPEEKKRIGKDL